MMVYKEKVPVRSIPATMAGLMLNLPLLTLDNSISIAFFIWKHLKLNEYPLVYLNKQKMGLCPKTPITSLP
jgi:hypothetical protein